MCSQLSFKIHHTKKLIFDVSAENCSTKNPLGVETLWIPYFLESCFAPSLATPRYIWCSHLYKTVPLLFAKIFNISETHKNYNSTDSTKKVLQTFLEYKTFYFDAIFGYLHYTCEKTMHMNSLCLRLVFNTFYVWVLIFSLLKL